MLKTFFASYRPRDWIALVAAALILAICGALGASYDNLDRQPTFSAPESLLYICIGTLALALFFLGANLALDLLAKGKQGNAKTASDASTSSRPSRVARIVPNWSPANIALFSAIMLLCWLPWLIAYFPAPLNVDLYYQLYQFFPDSQNYIIPFGGYDHNVPVDAWLVDHHPFFTTIVYGMFAWVSEQLTGTWEAGIFVCSFIQSAAFTVAFTSTIAFLRRRGCPPGLCLGAWIFLALVPFIPVWASSLTKDSTFALFFLGWLMLIFRALETGGEMLRRPRNIALVILCSLALCLTKKTGVFLVIIVCLFLAFRFRKVRRCAPVRTSSLFCESDSAMYVDANVVNSARSLGADASGSARYVGADVSGSAECVDTDAPGSARYVGAHLCALNLFCESETENAPTPTTPSHATTHLTPTLTWLATAATCALVMFALLPALIFPAFHIAPGGRQEALGLPFQQTALYVVQHPDEVTSEEQAAISQVLAYDELADSYDTRVHDYVKFLFNQDASTADIANYLTTYISMGLKHPETYFDGFMSAATFYLSPNTPVYITLASSIDFPRDIAYTDREVVPGEPLFIWAPPEVAPFKDAICGAYYTVIDLRIIGWLFKLDLYCLWIPVALLLFMLRRRIPAKVLLLPGFLIFATCLISPIGATRYTIPLLLTAIPLILMSIALCRKLRKAS